ncbi:MAG: heterodisulfide reductase-related iron-sulfur binding cluster [Candidatus Thermoplasmatota archaeon]|nr:heterodisulfide reductase-related iron-sulfur binding cluster [Candidatus Thermoplasmatota archaeon]
MIYLFSLILIIGIVASVILFFYSLYEYAWNMLKIPLKKPRMKLQVLRRVYTVIKNVLFQRKLFKDPSGGVMHALMFWGFVAFGAYSLDFLATGADPSFRFFLSGIVEEAAFFTVDLFAVIVLVDVFYSILRRWVIKVPRYQGYNGFEAWFILLLIGTLMVSYYILGILRLQGYTAGIPGSIMGGLPASATPVTAFLSSIFVVPASYALGIYWSVWSIHALDFLVFLVYIPRSKHLHLVAAPLNVLLYDYKPRGELTVVDFEKETRFGATDVRDFTWKDYLDFYSCTECGRCTFNCPAFLTGKTLSPRDIIWDLRETLIAQGRNLRRSGENPSESQQLTSVIGDPIQEEDLWSCTTCGACVEQCPVMIDHVDKIVDMRRSLVLNQGKAPKEALDLFRNIESYSSPWAYDPSTRGDWANGLDVVDLSKTPDAPFDYLYWVGCVGSYDPRNQEISKAVVKVLKSAGVKFAILGSEEKCTGDPARRAGNEYLAQTMIQQNMSTLNGKNVKKVITNCPHCFNSFKNDYKAFGLELEVHHHTEFIDSLVKEGKVKIASNDQDKDEKYTFHDSCYLGRYNNIFQQPRDVIGNFAVNYQELEMAKTKGFCCGAGGGRLFMDEKVGQKVSHKRIEMAEKANATTVVTACPYCMTMLDDARKVKNLEDKMKIKDLAELVSERLSK